jgi:copper chaperone NosL
VGYNKWEKKQREGEIAMKKSIPAALSAMVFAFVLHSAASAADVKPVTIKKSDKCAVCGMFVSEYKNWAAEIVFKDRTYAAFDGPKDMFKYYLDLPKYNRSKKQSDIAEIFVTEYYTTRMMEAQGLFFVRGSDVMGPMGAELVPVASMEKAQTFMKDHGGKEILRFSEITMEALK